MYMNKSESQLFMSVVHKASDVLDSVIFANIDRALNRNNIIISFKGKRNPNWKHDSQLPKEYWNRRVAEKINGNIVEWLALFFGMAAPPIFNNRLYNTQLFNLIWKN